jgi:hypothetical protein
MVMLSAGTEAQQTGRCYSADVQGVIVLPDGSEHDTGRLELCLSSKGPVEGSHRTYVDGRAIGEFRSRLGEAEGDAGATGAIFVFLRSPDGKLFLEGYTAAQGDRFWAFQMVRARRSMTAWRLGQEVDWDETVGGRIIRIASN